jgi:hypothetical protein
MTRQAWWKTDQYDHDYDIPMTLPPEAGPNGVAIVRVWPKGNTDMGWGLEGKKGSPGFMHRYSKGHFKMGPILWGYNQKRWAFAFVMRSMRVVCIDIDGKNGGDLGIGRLGMLPYTLAETSKSGDGYHLFYKVSEDEWDDASGFALFGDRIGIEQGVDFRGTGCVYHYSQQRWNGRNLAELPQHIKERLHKRAQAAAAQTAAIVAILDGEDKMEVVMMQDQLLQDLAKPIPAGRRNNTLFAIGTQLKLAQVPDWEKKLHARSLAVGLTQFETDKLVTNVVKYGGA